MHQICIITPIALTRQNFDKILSQQQYTYEYFNTILEYYEHEKYAGKLVDILIIEYTMNEEDLMGFVRHVRSEASGVRIPIMVLSSVSDRKTIVNLLRQGADDYVLKPFEPKNILDRLDRLINLYLPDIAKLFPQTMILDLGTILELEVARARRHNYSFSFVRLFLTIIESSPQVFSRKGEELVELMKECYALLQIQYRKTDQVLAYGGDSFVICLPYTDKEGTRIVISRMAQEMKKLKFKFPPPILCGNR